MKKIIILVFLSSIIIVSIIPVINTPFTVANMLHAQEIVDGIPPYMGVNMRGLHTSESQQIKRASPNILPTNYYDDSFRILSQAGMNHALKRIKYQTLILS